jgi:hypothetical protein
MKLEPPLHLEPGAPHLEGVPLASAVRPRGSRAGLPGSSSSPRRAPARSRLVVTALLVVAAVLLAGAWSLIARRELERARVEETAVRLDRARTTFDASRARAQEALRALCRVLAEDPRLKSTLATAGIDAATVDDILADLAVLRGGGALVVLSPEGRVFADAGVGELRGLDLSGSNLVRRAERERDAVVGSWALAGQVMDLAIMAIRFDESLVAYLVVGQSLDQGALQALAGQCGCEAASVLGDRVAASSRDGEARFASLAQSPGPWRARRSAEGPSGHISSAIELGDVTQSHRLIVATTLAAPSPPLLRLGWLLWFPPALVLASLLFAFSVLRSRSS